MKHKVLLLLSIFCYVSHLTVFKLLEIQFPYMSHSKRINKVELKSITALSSTLQDEGVESDDLKKDLPLMPPPPDSSSMKLTLREIWFSFAAPTNVRSASSAISRCVS